MTDAMPNPGESLAVLRKEFPHFRIWREITGDRTRYVARRVHPGGGPHTLVTDDLDELRSVLGDDDERAKAGPVVPFDSRTPNIARMYDYLLGGKDHYPADRDAAQDILVDFPEVAQVARANRFFVARTVRYVANQGVTQFIDVGSGLPTAPSVHETAWEVNPAARVAYADNDALVIAYSKALLTGRPGVTVLAADIRETSALLAHPNLRRLIDLAQPVCVLLAAVLHFLTPAEADATVAAFRAALAPGSYLVISAGTATGTSPTLLDRLRSAYANTADITGHPAEDIAAWFTGLHLIPPGLVDVGAWRPGSPRHWLTTSPARIIGAVGRKPGVREATGPLTPAPGGPEGPGPTRR
jgi:O-methyltransferase involved in polyketide biosynthesis